MRDYQGLILAILLILLSIFIGWTINKAWAEEDCHPYCTVAFVSNQMEASYGKD